MPEQQRDYYEVLGVNRDSTPDEIKRSFRRLARQYHPDVNKDDPQSEEKFKEVAEAFAVLSDSDKRQRYDRGGREAFGEGFDPFAGVSYDQFDFGFGGSFQEILSRLMHDQGPGRSPGRGARGQHRVHLRRRGDDLRFDLRVPFRDAIRGSTVKLQLPAADGSRRPRSVRLPVGVKDGDQVRLRGLGHPGSGGAPAGDVLLHVNVDTDPVFRREGNDLTCDVEIDLATAALGGTAVVQKLEGTATVTIPAGTRSGQRLRIRGAGVPAHGKRAAGNLVAIVQIVPPTSLDPRSRELLEEFRRLNAPAAEAASA
jgi:DnaJ-class molecular chaperone